MKILYKVFLLVLALFHNAYSSLEQEILQSEQQHRQTVEQEYLKLLSDPSFDFSCLFNTQLTYQAILSNLSHKILYHWLFYDLQELRSDVHRQHYLAECVAARFLDSSQRSYVSQTLLHTQALSIMKNNYFKNLFFQHFNLSDFCKTKPFKKQYVCAEVVTNPVITGLNQRVRSCLPTVQADEFMKVALAACYTHLQNEYQNSLVQQQEDPVKALMSRISGQQAKRRGQLERIRQ